MSNFDPNRYTITIQFRTIEDDEDCFVGTVAELPNVVVYETTYSAAHAALIEIITDLKATADERGRNFPQPLAPQNTDSNRRGITLRLGRTVHQKSVDQARMEGQSLNAWISDVIAQKIERCELLREQKCGIQLTTAESIMVGFEQGTFEIANGSNVNVLDFAGTLEKRRSNGKK